MLRQSIYFWRYVDSYLEIVGFVTEENIFFSRMILVMAAYLHVYID